MLIVNFLLFCFTNMRGNGGREKARRDTVQCMMRVSVAPVPGERIAYHDYCVGAPPFRVVVVR